MPIYNLIEYSDKYLTQEILQQYCKGKPALAANAITDFTVGNAVTDLFKIKEEITSLTRDNGTK